MEIDFTKTTSFKSSEDLMIGNIIQYKKGHLAKIEELTDTGLVSVTLSTNVAFTAIPNYAFQGCSLLNSITIQ